MALPVFCILCLVTSLTRAYYIQMSPISTMLQRDLAEQECHAHGMTLPVLHTHSDWATFTLSIDDIIQSQGYTALDLQPWVGLTHDGSNLTDPDHFIWADGQVAEYINATDIDMITRDNSTSFVCVRNYQGRMRLTNCVWKRHVVCQGDLQNISLTSPIFYVLNRQQNDTSRAQQTLSLFVRASNQSQLPDPLSMRCLHEVPVDNIDCFLLCVLSTSCHVVALLHDRSACFLQV